MYKKTGTLNCKRLLKIRCNCQDRYWDDCWTLRPRERIGALLRSMIGCRKIFVSYFSLNLR